MREHLREHHLKRLTFRGIFVRFGSKAGWKGRTEQTVLLNDIRVCDPSVSAPMAETEGEDNAGNLLTDHLWFNLTKEFAALELRSGDVVKFDARVCAYRKGYLGEREVYDKPPSIDYKLSRPTHVRKLTPDESQLPLYDPVFSAIGAENTGGEECEEQK